MAEDNTTDTLLEWFKTNLPKDYDLQAEIANRADQVLKHIKIDPNKQVNLPIFLGVANSPNDPSRLTISANVYGVIILGVMAKAILDSLSGEFQALLSSEIGKVVLDERFKDAIINLTKKCANCQKINRPGANYCDGCGKNLNNNSKPGADSKSVK